jgi:hypothetical protein
MWTIRECVNGKYIKLIYEIISRNEMLMDCTLIKYLLSWFLWQNFYVSAVCGKWSLGHFCFHFNWYRADIIFTMFYHVPIYTIHGTDIPYVFSYYVFRPDRTILRYIRSHKHLFLFLLLSLHWPVFTYWECVVCMVLCDALCRETYQ